MFTQTKKLLKTPLAILASAGLLAVSAPALAHHAFSAEFDGDQPVTVKGVVTKFELVNPHSWIYVDVKNPDGTVSNWGFEFGAPFSLKEKGLTKKTFPAGTELSISGFRAKSGKNFGYATSSTLADGRTFLTGGAQDAPTPPVAPAPAAAAPAPAAR